ncbi:MAG: Mycofactocin system glycosyltransferase [Candidatus Bathyarchaeota archaeon B23]|nr:MAG: Mycofactocin system glycosyltransferase [Candidatus Bathyarchaeota archaeon B23]
MPEGRYEPHISVVIPVKNSAGTIGELLDSLMKLDYNWERLEILVVDGRSTDGTREIVERYPVRLLEEEGRGLNAARNTGVRYSKGEIIAFTDGDCIVPSDWVRTLAENFRDPSVGFVGGLVEGYHRDSFLSIYMDETLFHAVPSFTTRSEATDLRLLRFPAGCNMAFRRHALEKIDLFDERIYYGFDDLEPVEELGLRGFRIVLDPRVLIWHKHRTTLWAMIKQHFNYGRGGALLLIYKRASRLSRWFSAYLFSTTLLLSLILLLLTLGLTLMPKLLRLLVASLISIYMLHMALYSRMAMSSKRMSKMLLYPLLDILRGLSFTLGGLFQLGRSLLGRG